MKNRIYELKDFYILWSTQGLSQLGSAMMNFALTLWLYQETGSALQTATVVHLFLCAICYDEHFRRSAIRQMGQEKDYADL